MDPIRSSLTWSTRPPARPAPAAAPADRFDPAEPASVDLRRAAGALLAGGSTGAALQADWTVHPPSGRFTTPPSLGPAGLAVGGSRGLEGGRIGVYDPSSGAERWTADLPHDAEWCAQDAAGTVYVSGRFGYLKTFSRDGEEGWTLPVGIHLGAPPVFLPDGTFVGLQGGRVVARDPSDGAERWQVVNQLGLRASGPVVVGDGVMVHADNGLFHFDGSTGRVRWHLEEATTPGAVAGSKVWAGGEHALLEVDAGSGEVLGRVELPGSPVAAPAVGDDGTVYVPLRGSQVVAVKDGVVAWEGVAYTDRPSFLTPVGDTLLVGTVGSASVAVMDRESGFRRLVHQGEKPSTGPAASDGQRAFLATSDALSAHRGRLEVPAAPAERPAGGIEEGEQTVTVGGVELPVRRR